MKALIQELRDSYPLVPRRLQGLRRRFGDRERLWSTRPVDLTAEQLAELEALRRVAGTAATRGT